MKRFIVVGLFLITRGLYAMEENSNRTNFLPPDMISEIARHALSAQMPIPPKEAMRTVGEYSHESEVREVSWSPDSRYLVSCGYCKPFSRKPVVYIVTPAGKVETEMYDAAKAVVWSPNGQHIALLEDREVSIVTPTGLVETSERGRIDSVSWSPDGQCLALRENDGVVKIITYWGLIKAQFAAEHDGWNNSVSWSPDGQHLALSGPKKVKIVTPEGEPETEYKFAGWPVGGRSPMAWSPDSKYLALGGQREVKIVTPVSLLEKKYQHDNFASVSWSPNSQHLALNGVDNTIKIITPRGELETECKHGGQLNSVSWSPDGRHLASGGNDPCVKIVNFKGELETEYKHDSRISSIAWSPDGKYLALGGYDYSDGCKVKIKNMVPFLLATHTLKHPTFSQLCFLVGLQETLLKRKEPPLIGKSDRDLLNKMPNLKKLLKIEKSRSNTQNPIWRLSLQGIAEESSSSSNYSSSSSSSSPSSSTMGRGTKRKKDE